jgi:magnesium transporter
LLELRRVAASQREMMQPVARGDYDYITEALEHRFGQVRDHLEKVVGQIDTLRERIYGIRDNYHSALALRSNDIMKALTIFAAILLPCSVIAGVYGMNLPLWPPPEHPWSFWFVLGLMIVIPGALLYLFRRKKMDMIDK